MDTMNTISSQEQVSGSIGNVSVSPMVGGVMSNVAAFVKKNAVIIGIGVVALGAAIYFATRKNKKSKGLSGVSRRRSTTNRSRRKHKRLTTIELS